MVYDELQQKVIDVNNGRFLVLAPPGCGKTQILSERIFKAHEKGVPYEDMLCLTFTNRASRGMVKRIRQEGKNTDGLFVGNLHRFCSQFLFDNKIINPDTSILDELDITDILNSYEIKKDWDNYVLNSYDPKKLKKLFVDPYRRVISISHYIDQLIYGHEKEVFLYDEYKFLKFFLGGYNIFISSPDEILGGLDSLFDKYKSLDYQRTKEALQSDFIRTNSWYDNAMPMIISIVVAAFKYRDHKMNENLTDFDSLLIDTYGALKTKDSIRNSYKYTNYHWIQIDEVQDLNPLQFAIAEEITAKENETVVYLGDEQQAIFSFMGARLDSLTKLASICGESNIIHLKKNYRSPKYLLDVFNDYATNVLSINKNLLPKADNFDKKGEFDLMIRQYPYYDRYGYKKKCDRSYYTGEQPWVYDPELPSSCFYNESISKALKFYSSKYPDERTAVIVNFNKEADELADLFYKAGLQCYKISGQDIFKTFDFKTLLAHFSVIGKETNCIEWARVLYSLGAVRSFTDARNLMSELRKCAMSPVDLLEFDEETYLHSFCKIYEEQEFVIFDTETTGLNVYEDDIVQIAAFKVKDGKKVEGSDFNLFLQTNREIPAFLGELVNPLIEEYKDHEHIDRNEGLLSFIEYVGTDPVLGHNVNYDYSILKYNLLRDCNGTRIENHLSSVWDSLKLMRLIEPRMKVFKLKILLEKLHLEGENSHLADADIAATKSVVDYIYKKGVELWPKQLSLLEKIKLNGIADTFRDKYLPIYEHTKSMLGSKCDSTTTALSNEMRYVYDAFVSAGYINEISKIGYLYKFLDECIIDKAEEPYLSQQIDNHIVDIHTFSEADLCDSSIIEEKVFLMTVHKAKGLEFENVIIAGAVNGVYPFWTTIEKRKTLSHVQVSQLEPRLKERYIKDTQALHEEWLEDARKLYVGLSRAKKRLCVTCYDLNSNGFEAGLSEYMNSITEHFIIK